MHRYNFIINSKHIVKYGEIQIKLLTFYFFTHILNIIKVLNFSFVFFRLNARDEDNNSPSRYHTHISPS